MFNPLLFFFVARARCLSAGLRYLRLTRLPRHDRGPVPGGNRSAASCQCTVLRRASYHCATRSPSLCSTLYVLAIKLYWQANKKLMAQLVHNAPTRRALLENKQTKHYEPRNDLSTHRSMDQLKNSLSFFLIVLNPPIWYYALSFSRGQIIWIHNLSICIFAHLCNTNPKQVASMHWKITPPHR